MFLPNVCVGPKIFFKSEFLGIDTFNKCLDKKHFQSFPYRIDYQYNSRGFRDKEWPDTFKELQDSIWCVGDSFTLGTGSPIEHTWVSLLEQNLKKRCINISRDGASNYWIARYAVEILSTVKPNFLIIHWSYSHRTEQLINGDYKQLQFSYDNLSEITKIENFFKIMELVQASSGNTKIINSFIPYWHPNSCLSEWDNIKGSDWPEQAPITIKDFRNLSHHIQNEIKSFEPKDLDVEDLFDIYQSRLLLKSKLNNFCYIDEFEQLDYARDKHHYDYVTANYFSNLLIDKLRSISSAEAI